MTQKTQEQKTQEQKQKPMAQKAQDTYDGGGEDAMWQLLQARRRAREEERQRPDNPRSGLVFLEDGSVVKHANGAYRFAWTRGGELQTGERNTETKPGRALGPEEHPWTTYDWPDSENLHQTAMKILSEEAHDQLDLEWFTTDIPELDEHESYAAVPELRQALMDTVRDYFPSDLLANLLDQETRELAHTALDSLTEPQRDVLVKAAASSIKEQADREQADRDRSR